MICLPRSNNEQNPVYSIRKAHLTNQQAHPCPRHHQQHANSAAAKRRARCLAVLSFDTLLASRGLQVIMQPEQAQVQQPRLRFHPLSIESELHCVRTVSNYHVSVLHLLNVLICM